jgi:hypothetical protein
MKLKLCDSLISYKASYSFCIHFLIFLIFFILTKGSKKICSNQMIDYDYDYLTSFKQIITTIHVPVYNQ